MQLLLFYGKIRVREVIGMKKETMTCPFCGFEMLAGEIWTGQAIDFRYEAGPSKYQEHTPAVKHLSMGSPGAFMTGTCEDAWACKRCGKVIIDCKLRETGIDIDRFKKRKVFD